MDVECQEHCRVLVEKWPQNSLHHSRPQVGHSCSAGRFHRQGNDRTIVYDLSDECV